MAGDRVAGTWNPFCGGVAVLIGTFAGHSAAAHRLQGREGVFEKLLDAAGVRPDCCGKLLRRRRVLGDKQAWFLINPTGSDVTEDVPLEGFNNVRDLLGDAVVRRGKKSVRVRVPSVNLCCLVVSA
jgi:hypothetical protein